MILKTTKSKNNIFYKSGSQTRYFRKRSRRKKGLKFFVRLILYSVTLIILVGAIYLLIWSPFFRVKSIIVLNLDEEIVDSHDIEIFILDQIKESQSFVIPSDSIFYVNTQLIEMSLLEEFQKFRSVSVAKRFPEQIRITVDERKPYAIWCVENCGIVDTEGVVYESLENVDTTELLKFQENKKIVINDDGTVVTSVFAPDMELNDVEISETSIPVDLITFTTETVQLLKERLDIDISTIAVPEKYSRQVSLLTDLNYKIIMNTDLYSPERVIDILRSLEDQDAYNVEDLVYIDLRITNKALTCKKGARCAQVDRGEVIEVIEEEQPVAPTPVDDTEIPLIPD